MGKRNALAPAPAWTPNPSSSAPVTCSRPSSGELISLPSSTGVQPAAPTPAAAPNRAVPDAKPSPRDEPNCTPPPAQHGATSVSRPRNGPTYADVVRVNILRQPSSCAKHKEESQQVFERFLNFLDTFAEVSGQPPFYKAELFAMRAKSSYTIKVYYEHMWKFKDVDLIIATYNSQSCLGDWLLPAARQFLSNENFVNEATRSKTCLSFVGFPASMQKLEDFWQKCPLVHPVQVFEGKISILAATGHGRLLFEILMVAISENHSKNFSWNGTFNIADILIINSNKMKILTEPVKVEGRRLLEARVKDLHRAAEIFIPLYKSGDVLPIYFDQLKKDLEGATKELVAKEWFMEYLSYHVAIMPSMDRRNLEVSLHSTCTNCKVGYMPFMAAKPTVYPNDWRTIVKAAEKDGINVLGKVYYYNCREVMPDPYDSTVRGLIKFKRNVLEHGGQYIPIIDITELELYAAKMFSDFLPSLLRTLLEQGQMVKFFGEAWSSFKTSQSDRKDSWSN